MLSRSFLPLALGTALLAACGSSKAGACPNAVDCAGVCGGSATTDACGTCDADPTNDCATAYEVDGGWSCPAGQSCQDVHDVELQGGHLYRVAVSAVTGGSQLRLSFFSPGAALSDVSGLTALPLDRSCPGQDAGYAYSVQAGATGVFRFAVGREASGSTGDSGTYHLSITSPATLVPRGRSVDDGLPLSAGFTCGAWQGAGTWSCAAGSCEDVIDVTLAAGTRARLVVDHADASSATRLSVVGPGAALDGENLLTGEASDRLCVGPGAADAVQLLAPVTGTYRIALGRDAGSSSGTAGSYHYSLVADRDFDPPVKSATGQPSSHASTLCGSILHFAGGWDCAQGVTCQDVYDVELLGAAQVSAAVSSVTGNSVARLSAVAGPSLGGTNLLNGKLSDRSCVRQDESDASPAVPLAPGRYRFAVARDWGASLGASGTYAFEVRSTAQALPLGQTASDELDPYATRSCP